MTTLNTYELRELLFEAAAYIGLRSSLSPYQQDLVNRLDDAALHIYGWRLFDTLDQLASQNQRLRCALDCASQNISEQPQVSWQDIRNFYMLRDELTGDPDRPRTEKDFDL